MIYLNATLKVYYQTIYFQKQLNGRDFNLDDNEETLTHYGQSLAENLQDTINSDSDDDEQAVKAVTGTCIAKFLLFNKAKGQIFSALIIVF